MGRISSTIISGSNLKFGYPKDELIDNLNADMVDGFHASSNPEPNKIIALDPEGILNLSATYAKINIYSFRRVDLTGVTEDYKLEVGEEAEINFENATNVALHIATSDGTYYQMDLIPSNPGGTSGGVSGGHVLLLPNNIAYSNAIVLATIIRESNGFKSAYFSTSGFEIGAYYALARCFITNRTVYKNVQGITNRYGNNIAYPSLMIFSSDWRDTTTPWTSLGTISFPQNTSGKILIRRLK